VKAGQLFWFKYLGYFIDIPYISQPYYNYKRQLSSTIHNGKVDSLQTKACLPCQETHRRRVRSHRRCSPATTERKAAHSHYPHCQGGERRERGGRAGAGHGYARFVLVRHSGAFGPPGHQPCPLAQPGLLIHPFMHHAIVNHLPVFSLSLSLPCFPSSLAATPTNELVLDSHPPPLRLTRISKSLIAQTLQWKTQTRTRRWCHRQQQKVCLILISKKKKIRRTSLI